MLCDAIFSIFWLYTTSDSFVKDAELEYVVETIPEKTEETKEERINLKILILLAFWEEAKNIVSFRLYMI